MGNMSDLNVIFTIAHVARSIVKETLFCRIIHQHKELTWLFEVVIIIFMEIPA